MKRFLLNGSIIIIIFVVTFTLIGNIKADNGISSSKDDLWEPNKPVAYKSKSLDGNIAQAINATNAVLINNNNGEVLFEKNSKKHCFPASTTKILTALVALEIANPDERVVVGDEANFPAPGSSISGIRYGEKLTLGQLLNCLLIPSGNDAAYVIARFVGEKASKGKSIPPREAVSLFCSLMNKRAKELGAKSSNFINPDGFHKPQHYTTAYDIGIIAREAMKHKEFRNTVIKTQFSLPDIKVRNNEGKEVSQARRLFNTNKLLFPEDKYFFAGTKGIKTGHTSEAGYCLVSSAESKGKNVISVVMNSIENEVWADSRNLLKLGLYRK